MAETLKITKQGWGIPLVLIHGWGLNSGVWQPLSTHLAPYFKVITVDLPGFGINADSQLSPYSLANVCRQVQQSVAEPAIYLGWSLGGLVTTQMALSYPDQVVALITVASSPCFIAKPDWPGIKAELLGLFHRQLSQDIQKTLSGFLKIQAMGSPHIRQDLKQIHDLVMQYPMPSKKTLDDSLDLLETVDLREQMGKVSQPFLRLYGALDSLVPKTTAALVSELAVNSEQHVFARASHAPFISNQEQFVAYLLNWLRPDFIR